MPGDELPDLPELRRTQQSVGRSVGPARSGGPQRILRQRDVDDCGFGDRPDGPAALLPGQEPPVHSAAAPGTVGA